MGPYVIVLTPDEIRSGIRRHMRDRRWRALDDLVPVFTELGCSVSDARIQMVLLVVRGHLVQRLRVNGVPEYREA